MDYGVSVRLDRFLSPFVRALGRSERRKWGETYVRALMLGDSRRNPRRMSFQGQGDEQSLQQFVHQSPWDEKPLLDILAAHAEAMAPGVRALILDDTGFPKQGKKSVGVSRVYSGTLGKVGNCQIGVSLSLGWDDGAIPLDMELYLPESWTESAARLRSAGLPEDTPHRKKWQIGLELIDAALKRGVSPGIVSADAGYGVATEFRQELAVRDLEYSLGVQKNLSLWRVPHEPNGMAKAAKRGVAKTSIATPSQTALQLAQSLPETEWKTVSWREGQRDSLKSRFACVKVEPTHVRKRGTGTPETAWLLMEWPENESEPDHYWLMSPGCGSFLEDLVYWAKIRWIIEKNYRDLKTELGLDHFEGRSYRGWRHHIALTLVAHLFLVSEDLRQKKLYAVEPA